MYDGSLRILGRLARPWNRAQMLLRLALRVCNDSISALISLIFRCCLQMFSFYAGNICINTLDEALFCFLSIVLLQQTINSVPTANALASSPSVLDGVLDSRRKGWWGHLSRPLLPNKETVFYVHTHTRTFAHLAPIRLRKEQDLSFHQFPLLLLHK